MTHVHDIRILENWAFGMYIVSMKYELVMSNARLDWAFGMYIESCHRLISHMTHLMLAKVLLIPLKKGPRALLGHLDILIFADDNRR